MLMIEHRIQSRRAIEALRSGVPNRDAVQALGTTQHEIDKRFRQQLEGVTKGFPSGESVPGMLVMGDFGSGKSHLLDYLQEVALENHFVCSKVVVSKETPLHDPVKLLTAAVECASLPDKTGNALNEVVRALKFDSKAYAEFFKWVNDPANGLDRRFAATLYVLEYARGERSPETADRIIQFWSGHKLGVSELKEWLRQLGEIATYRIDPIAVRELAIQRFQFLPRLAIAAGYAGWIILVDEVELIGRYSFRQRAKSYAELARLLGKTKGFSTPGMASVLAITANFEAEVLDHPRRLDEERVPNRLQASGIAADALLAAQAERGMTAIRRDRVRLTPPSQTDMQKIHSTLQQLHAEAYQWQPSSDYSPPDRTDAIRRNVKRWIYQWDLLRAYPEYKPSIQEMELREDLSEQLDLEKTSEPDEDSQDR